MTPAENLPDDAQTLRSRLRSGLRPMHDSVDAAFTAFDTKTRDGYVAYLKAQWLGFDALWRACDPDAPPRIRGALTDLCNGISHDLSALSDGTPAPLPPIERLHPLAIEYMFLGSRLGAAMQFRTWSRDADPNIIGYNHVFDAPAEGVSWPDLCIELKTIPASGALPDLIERHAARAFAVFLEGANAASLVQGARTDDARHLRRHATG